MDPLARVAGLEWLEKLVHQLIGRAAPPCRRAVEIHAHLQTVVPRVLQDAFPGLVDAEAETLSEVLQQGGLAVAGVAAEHDQTDLPFHDVAMKRLFQVRFDVGCGGEVGVQAPRLEISPFRARIGLEQRPEPWRLVLGAPHRRRYVRRRRSRWTVCRRLVARRRFRTRLLTGSSDIRARMLGLQPAMTKHLDRRSGRLEAGCAVRMRRPIQERGEPRVLLALAILPVQSSLLPLRAVMEKRLPAKKHMKEAGRQRVEVVGGRRSVTFRLLRPAPGRMVRRTVQSRAGIHGRRTDPAHAVVAREHQLAGTRHDHVPGAEVAVDESVVVQRRQCFTGGQKPAQRQRLAGLFPIVLGQKRQHFLVLGQRVAVDPGHERDEFVLLPLGGNLEDRRQRMTQARVRQLAGLANAPAGLRVEDDLADMGAQVFAAGAVDLHHLEGRAESARTQSGHDAVPVAAERDLLTLGPETRCRLPLRRPALAEQRGQRRGQPGQIGALPVIVFRNARKRFAGSAREVAVAPVKQDAQRRAQRADVQASVGGAAIVGTLGGCRLEVHPGDGCRIHTNHPGRRLPEVREQGLVVVPDEDRTRTQEAAPRLVVGGARMQFVQGAMQFVQGTERPAGEVQPSRRIPAGIGRPLLDGGRSRVGDGEELELARMRQRVLEGIEDASGRRRRPSRPPGLPCAPPSRSSSPS